MKRALTVYYDHHSMELTKVTFGKEFELGDALARADVLRDAVEYIIETYNTTLIEMDLE